jgi:cell division septum initiation protein DivIVA
MLTLTTQLDRIENALPTVPARVVRLQRVVAGGTYDQVADAVQTVVDSTRNLLETARVSARTVTGQTRAASTDLLETARRNAKQVVGQTRAQGRRVAATATQEATDVLDSAIDAVDPSPGSGKPYEQWTKAELLTRAQELGIEGRTTLNKKQLISALRNA